MEAEQITKNIGKRIRELRNMNGLTQQELADRTELTKGYISQLENGLVTPSTASAFFEETEPEQVVFSNEGFFEKIDEAGNSIQWIVPTAQKNQMEPLLVDLKPRQKLFEHKPHEGEEFGYVLQGRIRLHLDDRQYTVKKGESFYYSSDHYHFIENASASPARFLWISTPPTF